MANTVPTQFRRAGQTSDSASFNVENLMYPEDLTTDPKNHYVVFFINIPGNSKISRDKNPTLSGRATGKDTRGSSKIAAAADKTVGKDVTLLGSKIDFAPGYKQLKSAIALYMPNAWQESYSATYERAESGLINLLLDAAKKSNGQAWDATKEMGKAVAARTVQGVVGNIISAVSGGDGVANKIMGKMTNPNAEQVFNGMEFRQFNFEFLMAPRSRSEADNCLRIIDTFKYYMHPEIADANYLIFPAEFEIDFYSDGDVNRFIGSISTCALTNVTVDYAPNGVWSAFKDTRGIPTAVKLNLTFVELEPLTKDRLDDFNETGTYEANTSGDETAPNFMGPKDQPNVGNMSSNDPNLTGAGVL